MDHQSIITDLGGIRPLARKLGHVSHTIVQGWYERNRIPLDRWPEVIAAAQADGKAVSTDDLMPAELRPTQASAA
jgi:hypothetical protein